MFTNEIQYIQKANLVNLNGSKHIEVARDLICDVLYSAVCVSPFSVCSMICRTAFLRLLALHIRASRGLNIA